MKQDNAFTGLEAAIVLIAFVVVAAIFSYVMLGAGFFATQKAQEVTYAGVKQTTSNLIPDGTLYGTMADPAGTHLEYVQISVSVPIGGQSQELAEMLITYTAEGVAPINFVYDGPLEDTTSSELDNIEANTFRILKPCTSGIEPSDTSVLVTPGNSCSAVLYLDDNGPSSGQWFQLEIKPPIGAPTTMRKTIATGYKGGTLL